MGGNAPERQQDGTTVKLAVNRRIAGIAAVSALAITLSACGQDATTSDTGSSGSGSTDSGSASGSAAADLSGSIAGAGASSQENAENAWMAEFMSQNPGVTVSYDAVGSGGGREQFIAGTVQFAGTDSALSEDEIASATQTCSNASPIEVPLYVSPIAVIFNLPGIESLNMSPDTIAGIFSGQITTWDDAAIAADNPDVELPSTTIIPVNRSDDSGTTKNFTQYLSEAAPTVWTYDPDGVWPIDGTQSGAQTAGMLEVVQGAEGTIGYADASRAGDLGTVAVGVGGDFVPYSAEAAASVLEHSEPSSTATDLLQSYDLVRDEAGTYPIVLVSYLVACSVYADQATADNVAAYLSYIASSEGQDVAAQPDVAGSAPISDTIRENALSAIDQITAG